ncbi:MAG TPA: hypothetical protein VFZ53_33830 [Polyangiaceae bacterium]
MKQHVFVVFLVAATLALAGVVLLRPWSRAPRTAPTAPLAVIPAGAAFVGQVDLARLRKTAAGTQLFSRALQSFAAPSSSAEFQPLRDVDEIVLAVAGDARVARSGSAPFEPNAAAVVAAGRFRGKAAADAAVEHIRARGGEPVRTRLGSFESVRDLRASGEVAARDGLVVLSDGAYFRAVLAAAEGQRTDGSEVDRTRDRVHVELRRTFGKGAPVIATVTLPEGSLETALGDREIRRSPLALVRSAALRVNVGDTLDVDALFVCESKDACSGVAKFLVEAKSDLERAFGATTLLLGFRRVGEQTGPRVELSLSLTPSELNALLESH